MQSFMPVSGLFGQPFQRLSDDIGQSSFLPCGHSQRQHLVYGRDWQTTVEWQACDNIVRST